MAILFSDNFTGADTDPIGGNYTTVPTLGNCQRASNTLQGSISGDCSVYVNSIADIADGYVRHTLFVAASGSSEGGARFRLNSATDASYIWLWNNIGEFHLYDWHAGSKTLIAAVDGFRVGGGTIDVTATFQGDHIVLSVVGSGVVIDVHDSTYTTGKTGVLITRQADPTALTIDNLEIGTNDSDVPTTIGPFRGAGPGKGAMGPIARRMFRQLTPDVTAIPPGPSVGAITVPFKIKSGGPSNYGPPDRTKPQQFADTFPPAVGIEMPRTLGRIHPGRSGPPGRFRIPQLFADPGVTAFSLNLQKGLWSWAGVAGIVAVVGAIGAWQWTGVKGSLTTEFSGAPGQYQWVGKPGTIALSLNLGVGQWSWAGASGSIATSLAGTPGQYQWTGLHGSFAGVVTIDGTVGPYVWAGVPGVFEALGGGALGGSSAVHPRRVVYERAPKRKPLTFIDRIGEPSPLPTEVKEVVREVLGPSTPPPAVTLALKARVPELRPTISLASTPKPPEDDEDDDLLLLS